MDGVLPPNHTDEDMLIAPSAKATWETYCSRLKLWKELNAQDLQAKTKKRKRQESKNTEDSELLRAGGPADDSRVENIKSADVLYDTVGAICVDDSGRTAAGVSRY